MTRRRRRRQTLPASMTSKLLMTRRHARHLSAQRHTVQRCRFFEVECWFATFYSVEFRCVPSVVTMYSKKLITNSHHRREKQKNLIQITTCRPTHLSKANDL